MHTAQFKLHAEIEDRHWWFVARRQIMRQVAHAVVPPSRGTLAIDVGCGTGANLAALADGYRCVGIDTSAEAVAMAERRFPHMEFRLGRAPDDLGDLMQHAQLILLMDVLEHVSDDFAMLSELLAAASPGTHFLITVPADQRLWGTHDVSFGHYRRYDQPRLERTWEGLPVTPLAVSYFSSRLLPIVRLVRWRNQRRGEAAGAAGTDFWLPSPPVNGALCSIMGGESRRILQVLQKQRELGYTAGSSLLAVIRRERGEIVPRTKPEGLAADHQPQTAPVAARTTGD